MKRWLAMAIVTAMLAVPAASAAGWLQPRGDAEATGYQPDDGPRWPDVALRAELPESMRAEADSPPLVLDEEVLFLARPYNDPSDDNYRVFAVDVLNGEVTTVAEGIDRANRLRMATDGETVYVSSRGTVHAFPLGPDGNDWTWDGEIPLEGTDVADHEAVFCGRMASSASALTVLCQTERAGQQPFSEGSSRGSVLLARLDPGTGDLDWSWEVPRDPQNREPAGAAGIGSSFPVGLAVSDTHVVVLTTEGGVSCVDCSQDQRGTLRSDAWGLTDEGELEWNRTLQEADRLQMTWVEQAPINENEPFWNVGNPAISDGAVYVKAGKMHKLNLGTGDPLWSKPIGEEDLDSGGGRSGAVSLTDQHVFTTSAQTLYRIDRDEPEEGWSRTLDFAAEEGFGENTIVTPSAVYNTVWSEEERESIVAFDTQGGSILWRHQASDIFSFSVGEDLATYTDVQFHDNDTATTTLVVLGHTDSSPSASAKPATIYPQPTEQIEVDLTASGPGLQGPPTGFMAIWGDGRTTGWQEDPVLNHTYEEAGDHKARFVVGNDAGQTNSTTVTFHVGEQPPVEPNWVAERFEKGNQDMTFGVIGVALALGGGAVGVARRKRKRSNLEKELEALEEGFEETKDDPGECEAFLDNRKARARSLMMDGYLEEEQIAIIVSRAEELRGELRSGMLDERFQFLPHGMVQSLKRMLADGTINAWERDTIEDLLAEDEALNIAQKERVRGLLERWSDASGGAGGGA